MLLLTRLHCDSTVSLRRFARRLCGEVGKQQGRLRGMPGMAVPLQKAKHKAAEAKRG